MKNEISFNDMPQALQDIMKIISEILSETQKNSLQKTQEKSKEILTVKDVCELLGINRTTLWNWEKKGAVKSYGVEGRKYFKRDEILNKLIPIN